MFSMASTAVNYMRHCDQLLFNCTVTPPSPGQDDYGLVWRRLWEGQPQAQSPEARMPDLGCSVERRARIMNLWLELDDDARKTLQERASQLVKRPGPIQLGFQTSELSGRKRRHEQLGRHAIGLDCNHRRNRCGSCHLDRGVSHYLKSSRAHRRISGKEQPPTLKQNAPPIHPRSGCCLPIMVSCAGPLHIQSATHPGSCFGALRLALRRQLVDIELAGPHLQRASHRRVDASNTKRI